VHEDEIDRYITRFELPVHWEGLRPAQKKDALMNALLARYGGVALDISVILLRPLDEYWNEMLAQGATFRGYMYRLNGMPWNHAEASAVWFLMSRREGIFSTAVRNTIIGMGDRTDTKAYKQWYLALGDQTLFPILSMFDYSLPKCGDDDTVPHKWACPELDQPQWSQGMTGPARNDTKIMLRDPRDGPQLPMAFSGMALWNIWNSSTPVHPNDNGPGFPMHKAGCYSMKECWEHVFLRRFNTNVMLGRTRPLEFVKLFQHGKALSALTREEMLANKDTYFYNWLKLAGHPDAS